MAGITKEALVDIVDGSLTVLVAQRHRAVAEALSRVIADVGPALVAAQVTNAQDAVEVGTKLGPDVAVIDIDLSPDCSLVTALKESSPDTRVIVMADRSMGGTPVVLKALESGAVGVIFNESSPEELARALRSSGASPVLAEEATGQLLNAYLDSLSEKHLRDIALIETLATAVEARDMITGHHIHRVTELAKECLEKVDADLARNEEVAFGFLLHDVGKIGVPDAILNKPGALDPTEWVAMRRHPELGVKIVDPIGFSPATTDVILHHHERWDGSGYPLGLEHEQIPLASRVFSLADVYDAMTSDRPYRDALSSTAVLEMIDDGRGSAFDPDVVDVFIDLKD